MIDSSSVLTFVPAAGPEPADIRPPGNRRQNLCSRPAAYAPALTLCARANRPDLQIQSGDARLRPPGPCH